MTMPIKIWVKGNQYHVESAYAVAPPEEYIAGHAQFIRADIAEDLAQALEAARDILKFYHAEHDMVDAALARFRA